MVTLYFHLTSFPTTRGRDFLLGLHVFLTQSDTLDVQGQGYELGVKSKKKNSRSICIEKYFVLLGMHVCPKQLRKLNVNMSRSCILTFC